MSRTNVRSEVIVASTRILPGFSHIYISRKRCLGPVIQSGISDLFATRSQHRYRQFEQTLIREILLIWIHFGSDWRTIKTIVSRQREYN